jgi:hypothetical protein
MSRSALTACEQLAQTLAHIDYKTHSELWLELIVYSVAEKMVSAANACQ